MKMREPERKYNAPWRTVRNAVHSGWPETRKKLPPRPTALDSDTGAGPGVPAPTAPAADVAATVVTPGALTAAQVLAATALWGAAAAALSVGVTAGGAVVQAELLHAAHTARLAGPGCHGPKRPRCESYGA
ncbi:hypothetical protein OIC43_42640 [Streptomyces sp. NBC_00825]|uniref:hypothetical protein n=1 Tax=unclassified Streptomyces TaxID=2593676 RepID=UPI002257DB36|nr:MULTISPECIES: hypothetical protein [unclassified Streptomyces]WTB51881.1 hypothetical protein OG832_01040 [Streptomyces sp. NBC_00826]WTH95227.1 hypothetical protein OIC43_42640 [Streptomyces sp. NBC_00825]WTI03961.1 hypothetical protein OHA23_42615 [Streptomyces sp. NBC_00822]MCX4869552.1 hypothetical protein [Streptomyces sp. NBC_00906]MCX4900791.1 hypothetical protein [Streptomyces sp. NBC_00892]